MTRQALLICAVIVLAACSSAPQQTTVVSQTPPSQAVVDKAGGGEPPITLHLGTPESDGSPVTKLLDHFADAVSARSSGRVTVDIEFSAARGANDFEKIVIDRVKDGSLDIAAVGSRAWGAQNVLAIRSLQAPFLIDGYPLLGQVLSGAVSDQLLASFDNSGYVGLALLADQLRHPLGFQAPITTLADFDGLHIRTPTSTVSDGLMYALGAQPEHLNGAELQEAISNGNVRAAETSVGNLTPFPAQSAMTANLTFFPLVRTLFMADGRFAAFSPTVQGVLRDAARDTQEFALGIDTEAVDIDAFCRVGGTFATASAESVAEIVAKSQPVTEDLRRDQPTASLIDQIADFKSKLGPPTPPSCPQ